MACLHHWSRPYAQPCPPAAALCKHGPKHCWLRQQPRAYQLIRSHDHRGQRFSHFSSLLALPPGYAIQPTSTAHVQQLADVEQLCCQWSAGWTATEIQVEVQRPFARALTVLYQDTTAVGYVVAWLIADELQVLEVAVHPEHQGRGLGSALLLQLMANASGSWSKAVLEVKASNQPALQLYGKLGFKQVGRRKAYYPDGSDALLLEVAGQQLVTQTP